MVVVARFHELKSPNQSFSLKSMHMEAHFLHVRKKNHAFVSRNDEKCQL